MIRQQIGSTPVSRRATAVVVALLASLIVLGSASSALATEHHPKGDFAVFNQCPLSNSATTLCIFAQTESGEFTVGKKTVPIKNTITLQGGVHVIENKSFEIEGYEFIGAENGVTLSKTPQSVPGGLAGLVNCFEISNFFERLACELIFENGLTGVNATTELAAPASSIGINLQNLVEAEGTALSLPVKVKLDNPLLGESCYIGSNSAPISLPLTTGTTNPPAPNKSIKGKIGKVEFKDNFNLSIIRENSLVNNSFAAPGAEGCGGLFSFLIDPLVNAKLGVPATAGHNTAILNGTLQDANAPAVKASE
ncbi:MAG TPA: hypothetical protein VNY27_01590 [Solirubrobacteraceae bacterium]|jgi:hypothetical protein|nr:hypothetical protein [Solirubrobacteraceae bacterium]